jgi:hypothetical protein
MNQSLSRKNFLMQGSLFASAIAGGALPFSLSAKHHMSKRFTLGLSQYSLRALLRDGSLDALDFPQFTVDQFGNQGD